MNNLGRDFIEVLMVVAVGGILVSSISGLRRGEIKPVICKTCNRPTSRSYPQCKHCGSTQPWADDQSAR